MVNETSTRGEHALTPANQQLNSPAMAIREIIILPDKQLRLVSKPVEKVTAEVRKLADDMFETMYDAPGIGLAAIQVAQPLRLITMDLAKRDEDGESKPRPRVFINPEILSSSEDMSVYEEGCLSIPEYYVRWSGRRGCACVSPISTARCTKRTPRVCLRPASSTKSIISTACCLWIICRS